LPARPPAGFLNEDSASQSKTRDNIAATVEMHRELWLPSDRFAASHQVKSKGRFCPDLRHWSMTASDPQTGPMAFPLPAVEMIKRRRSLVLEGDELGIDWRGRTPH
jgi:hypothetical protein